MTIACVYVAVDESGLPLYVGMTRNMRRRIRQHRSTSAWWPLCARITHCRLSSIDAALIAEADLIATLHPAWNVQHRGDDRSQELPAVLVLDLADAGQLGALLDDYVKFAQEQLARYCQAQDRFLRVREPGETVGETARRLALADPSP